MKSTDLPVVDDLMVRSEARPPGHQKGFRCPVGRISVKALALRVLVEVAFFDVSGELLSLAKKAIKKGEEGHHNEEERAAEDVSCGRTWWAGPAARCPRRPGPRRTRWGLGSRGRRGRHGVRAWARVEEDLARRRGRRRGGRWRVRGRKRRRRGGRVDRRGRRRGRRADGRRGGQSGGGGQFKRLSYTRTQKYLVLPEM